MFSITKEKFGRFTKFKLANLKTGEYAAIIPGFGANINELVLQKDGKNHSVIDGDKEYGSLIKNEWYKGAKLAPFPNRIKDGMYSFNSRKYQLPLNHSEEGHAIHGFVYNKKFLVKRESEGKSKASAELEYSHDKETEGYPFSFRLNITYEFSKEGFACNTSAKNTGSEEMPFGDGWHPYFKIGKKVDGLFLKIPSSVKVDVDEKLMPIGTKSIFDRFVSPAKIEGQEFDACFELGSRGIAETELRDPAQNISVVLWQETGKEKYCYLQIYTTPSRESIALEPVTCITDAFNNKKGLIVLKPGQEFKGRYGVYIK